MNLKLRKQQLPWMMAAGRAALGPVLIAGQACRWNGLSLAALVVVALVSDIYDGVLARRWHCDTPAVRLFDSMADTVFYLSTAVALWMHNPLLWRSHAGLFGTLLALEAIRFAFDFAKFRKPASYHSYLAKCWGLVLATAVIASFVTSHNDLSITVSLGLGIVCDLEGLAMSMILPSWHRDVKTLSAAWRQRQVDLRVSAPSSTLGAKPKLVRKMAVAAMTLCIVPICHAVSPVVPGTVAATYDSGTANNMMAGSEGTLDLSLAKALVFRDNAHRTTLTLPYDSIKDFQYTQPVVRHLGILPAIAVALVNARQRKHQFTITYMDETDTRQVVLFDVDKQTPRALLTLLRARTSVCLARDSFCGGSLEVELFQ